MQFKVYTHQVRHMAMSRTPVPDGPRQQPFVTKGMKLGACCVPSVAACRAAEKD